MKEREINRQEDSENINNDENTIEIDLIQLLREERDNDLADAVDNK